MSAEALASKLAERVEVHENEKAALEERIARRKGDRPFDISADDGFETLGELRSRRAFHAQQASQLDLIRTHLVAGETYTLNLADLRAVDLVAPGVDGDEQQHAAFTLDRATTVLRPSSGAGTIQGLTLTMTGAELRDLLKDRIRVHGDCARRWEREQARTPDDQTEAAPLLPPEMCENEAERHEWRADVLGFIRDHIEPAETYRLGEADLAFGELLPAKPGWLEQEDYEERTAVGFQLERLVKQGRVRLR